MSPAAPNNASTALPWRWHYTELGPYLRLETEHRPIAMNDPVILAVREDWVGYLDRTETGRANLALIVRAVNNHDALVAALELCESGLSTLCEAGHHFEMMRDQARAALAAAREGNVRP